jgi:hypothetical protein
MATRAAYIGLQNVATPRDELPAKNEAPGMNPGAFLFLGYLLTLITWIIRVRIVGAVLQSRAIAVVGGRVAAVATV